MTLGIKKEIQRSYKCLPQKEFIYDNYKLVPIRDEDKYVIMKWRNEQIKILRQKEPLTKEMQETYFSSVVDELFFEDRPSQLLFSFLENNILIGYGGLVHIDWERRTAEISFLTATDRNKDAQQFSNDWSVYLKILKKISDIHLGFAKIFTYSYDIRPQLYKVLNENNFVEEQRIKDHVIIESETYDVLINSYYFYDLSFRMADKNDVMLYFNWANDSEVRANSYKIESIEYEDHCRWFFAKLASGNCFFYLFLNKYNQPVGQVRIDKGAKETTIGISVDKLFRGKSLSGKMLGIATDEYLRMCSGDKVTAYIKYENVSSFKSFITAGFTEQGVVEISGFKSYQLIRQK